MNPSIAVITPVRNGLPFLAEAIESIHAQNYEPLELLIIDDGSTDGTREFVRSLNGTLFRSLESNGIGPAAARNLGIRDTSCDLLAFLDADDLWLPGALHRLAQALRQRPEAGLAQGLIRNFTSPEPGRKRFVTTPYRFLNLGANLFRRTLFETVGLFDDSLRLCEDLDFFMRCWERDIRKAEVDQVVLYYRRHPGSMTHGLSGAGYGTVQAYKKKLDRIRRGEHDASIPRHVALQAYLGTPPASQDGNLHDVPR